MCGYEHPRVPEESQKALFLEELYTFFGIRFLHISLYNVGF